MVVICLNCEFDLCDGETLSCVCEATALETKLHNVKGRSYLQVLRSGYVLCNILEFNVCKVFSFPKVMTSFMHSICVRVVVAKVSSNDSICELVTQQFSEEALKMIFLRKTLFQQLLPCLPRQTGHINGKILRFAESLRKCVNDFCA